MIELPMVYTHSETNNLLLRCIALGIRQCVGQRTLQPQRHEHRSKRRVAAVPANKSTLACLKYEERRPTRRNN